MGLIAYIKNRMAGNKQVRNNYREIDVKFHKEARFDGEHGRVVVSHKHFGLDHVEVAFVFPGVTTPPDLTAQLMNDIYSAAEAQGYVVHMFMPHRYGRLIEDHREWNEIVGDMISEINERGHLSQETYVAVATLHSKDTQHASEMVRATRNASDAEISLARTSQFTHPDGSPVARRASNLGVVGEASLTFPRAHQKN